MKKIDFLKKESKDKNLLFVFFIKTMQLFECKVGDENYSDVEDLIELKRNFLDEKCTIVRTQLGHTTYQVSDYRNYVFFQYSDMNEMFNISTMVDFYHGSHCSINKFNDLPESFYLNVLEDKLSKFINKKDNLVFNNY